MGYNKLKQKQGGEHSHKTCCNRFSSLSQFFEIGAWRVLQTNSSTMFFIFKTSTLQCNRMDWIQCHGQQGASDAVRVCPIQRLRPTIEDTRLLQIMTHPYTPPVRPAPTRLSHFCRMACFTCLLVASHVHWSHHMFTGRITCSLVASSSSVFLPVK